jgi:hypothetical protein
MSLEKLDAPVGSFKPHSASLAACVGGELYVCELYAFVDNGGNGKAVLPAPIVD